MDTSNSPVAWWVLLIQVIRDQRGTCTFKQPLATLATHFAVCVHCPFK